MLNELERVTRLGFVKFSDPGDISRHFPSLETTVATALLLLGTLMFSVLAASAHHLNVFRRDLDGGLHSSGALCNLDFFLCRRAN